MIKTLIFDWGGVLTIGKYTPAILQVLSKERPISVEEIYPEFDKLVVQMNEGEISFKKFVHLVNIKFAIKITEEEMEIVFRKAIIPNEKVITLVKKLHDNYTLILMSDNDEATVKNLKRYHSEMLKLFSKKYFSNELKMRKPNLKFFKYVLRDAKLNPIECIFIDDKQKNVDAAKECGLNASIFSSIEQLKKEFAKFGILIK